MTEEVKQEAVQTTDMRAVVKAAFDNAGLSPDDWADIESELGSYYPMIPEGVTFDQMDTDSQIHLIRRALRMWLLKKTFNTFDMRQVIGGDDVTTAQDFIVQIEALAGMYKRALEAEATKVPQETTQS